MVEGAVIVKAGNKFFVGQLKNHEVLKAFQLEDYNSTEFWTGKQSTETGEITKHLEKIMKRSGFKRDLKISADGQIEKRRGPGRPRKHVLATV